MPVDAYIEMTVGDVLCCRDVLLEGDDKEMNLALRLSKLVNRASRDAKVQVRIDFIEGLKIGLGVVDALCIRALAELEKLKQEHINTMQWRIKQDMTVADDIEDIYDKDISIVRGIVRQCERQRKKGVNSMIRFNVDFARVLYAPRHSLLYQLYSA